MAGTHEFSLAELVICAAAEAWRDAGEVLATGIGPLPRVAAGLAKLTFAPGLLMTDGEAYLVEEPVPLGPRGPDAPRPSGWMPYGRVFDTLWSGKRHAMVTPVQVDRWAQANIAALGDLKKPKVQLLGVRGFPGNSISHKNSMFLPAHTKRAFVEGEVDVVASVGFSEKRWPKSVKPLPVDIGIVVTNLCVMDFNGPDHAARVISLHPGVTFEETQEQTGFPLLRAERVKTTPHPTAEQLAIIRKLDPGGVRSSVIKGDPPGLRAA
ncbi:MAG: ketoacid CoA transferase [Rhizobiales bacterium 65-9]|nr:ketoacid CoA transferase [Hyphomicrobiales bacterium]OJY39761.1 MAG: ketoacid CoA transferase [Rhizobiales bacterium 65-9]